MKILYYCFALSFILLNPAHAQILDDEESVQDNAVIENSDDSEELFDDIFSDHIEKEEQQSKDISFEANIDMAAENLKNVNKERQKKESAVELEALDGDLLIGITKGSFKVFNNISGRPNCFFAVTLKSNLNRDIKTLALRLIWQNRAFAFVFRDVPAKGAQERFISTSGKYCYNLSDVPDIDINMCKIKKAKGEECARRIKWDANLESPDPAKSPYK